MRKRIVVLADDSRPDGNWWIPGDGVWANCPWKTPSVALAQVRV